MSENCVEVRIRIDGDTMHTVVIPCYDEKDANRVADMIQEDLTVGYGLDHN